MKNLIMNAQYNNKHFGWEWTETTPQEDARYCKEKAEKEEYCQEYLLAKNSDDTPYGIKKVTRNGVTKKELVARSSAPTSPASAPPAPAQAGPEESTNELSPADPEKMASVVLKHNETDEATDDDPEGEGKETKIATNVSAELDLSQPMITDLYTLQRICSGTVDPTPPYEGQGEKESAYDASLLESSCKSRVNPLLIAAKDLQESGLNNSAREEGDTDGDGEANNDNNDIIDANNDGRSDDCITSPTGAKGIPQFTRGTGAAHGLIPDGVDIRCNPHRSIIEGGKYLGTLLSQYGNIEMALMGYNHCGESCLSKDVVRENGSNWKLIFNDPRLDPEPRIFVPAVMVKFRRYQLAPQDGKTSGPPTMMVDNIETQTGTFQIATMVVNFGPNGQSEKIEVASFCKEKQAFIEGPEETVFCSEGGLCLSIINGIPTGMQSIYIKGGENKQVHLRCV